MTLLNEIKRIPERSKHTIKKTYLLLKCDQCGIEFERGNNVSAIKKRQRHYCGFMCHNQSMKRGGKSDESRKATCREKYGADYFITIPEIAAQSGKKAHSLEIEAKRKAAIKKNMENYSIRLRRGLSLCRSKAEIDFLSKLAIELEDELEYQKYINGWWIDAYSPKYNCWIQFDGVYWHAKPSNVERDAKQNEWFEMSKQRLFRITDEEAKQFNALEKLAIAIKSSCMIMHEHIEHDLSHVDR